MFIGEIKRGLKSKILIKGVVCDMAISQSICWDCVRSTAIDGVACSLHTKMHEVPKGAVCETVTFKRGCGREGTYPAYKVLECPHYVEETKEIRAALKKYRIAHAEEPLAAEIKFYHLLMKKE